MLEVGEYSTIFTQGLVTDVDIDNVIIIIIFREWRCVVYGPDSGGVWYMVLTVVCGIWP